MTPKEFRALIDATFVRGDVLPGIRGSFRYLGQSRLDRPRSDWHRKRVVKVKTNKRVKRSRRAGAVAALFPRPLQAVYEKLCEDRKYFQGNRNNAFDELMIDRGFRHQGKRDKYPYLYTDEAYYIALAEELLSRSHRAS